MPRAARVDRVVIHADGQVQINYTAGETPLQITPSGQSFVYANRQALLAALEAAQDTINEEVLVLMGVAEGWTKADPSMVNPDTLVRREMQLDLVGGATVVRSVRR